MTLEDLRAICLSQKGATESIKWGADLVFSVGEKMFCVTGTDQTPAGASFKADDEAFEELCAREGFSPSKYLARYKWVKVDDIKRMSKAEWKKYIGRSYQLVREKLPAKIKKQLDQPTP